MEDIQNRWATVVAWNMISFLKGKRLAREECAIVSIRLRSGRLPLLPSGTTSNEALHAELNSWFRSTAQIHQATLVLKLAILVLFKLTSHNCALYRPTARQESSSVVLARAISVGVWSTSQWRAWCLQLCGHNTRKADTPLALARREQAATLRAWVLKRPAAALPVGGRAIKRTAFTLQRAGLLRKGGVKTTLSQKPASSRQ
jgi:hypothetical protein